MNEIEFANKEFFWLLLIIPVLAIWRWYMHDKNHGEFSYSTNELFQGVKLSLKQILSHAVFGLKLIAIGALITALARPQSATSWQDVTTEGIDIIVSLDISSSMMARDFKPNRLEASKNVAMEFVNSRPNDRIGLVIYSAESFTQCPLTTDHAVLKNLFKDIKNGLLEDGTAIGLGLATAVNRLKDSEAKSKIVILLTDGVNNSGSVPPLTAAEIAKAFGIRVYTIGVGTNGKAPYPVKTPFGKTVYQDVEVQIDEKTLREIADMTGGNYFRATNNKTLSQIYTEIDKLEKTKHQVMEYRKKTEHFLPWALAGTLLLIIEFILGRTYFRSVV